MLISDAIRQKTEQALKDNLNALLIHYDHGNETSLIGQDGNPVVDLENVILLKARACYNMNCLSARTLGKVAYENGCMSYWGYTNVVSFTTDVEKEFGEAFNYGLLLYVQGKDWKECLELTKARMTEIIDDLVKRGNAFAAILLREDRDALVCYNGGPPPPETCSVSRTIVKLFGYKTLAKLRKIRDRLTGAKPVEMCP